MPLKFNINTGKLDVKPLTIDEVQKIRLALERQNEILEKIHQSISATETTSTRIKENTEEK